MQGSLGNFIRVFVLAAIRIAGQPRIESFRKGGAFSDIFFILFAHARPGCITDGGVVVTRFNHTYMHAEGFAAGELKHGPIALLEDGLPVIVVVPPPAGRSVLHEKIVSNIQEVRARGARTIVIAEEGDEAAGAPRSPRGS